MSDSTTATTDQWLQFFDQPIMDAAAMPEGFSDTTLVTKTTTSPTMTMSSSDQAMTLSQATHHMQPVQRVVMSPNQ
ncbi:hypothetical protein L6164_037705 [Bauhinia variegata]|uniref:Uncharacterized protein n=1 Tax=Bauhinia variegata TaxID=167791 RepID=A0ACB9KKY9_BAUVA|nr:hypothetical protein L6164_037705 [Bauhinia variegata]